MSILFKAHIADIDSTIDKCLIPKNMNITLRTNNIIVIY